MERPLSMLNKCGILMLTAVCILGVAQPAVAGNKSDEVAAAPTTAVSIVVNVLARQIAFVKTFSVDYPYQFEQEKPGKKKSRPEKP